LKVSPLPKSSKEMHKYISSMMAPNLDFKKKYIINYENILYDLQYHLIIKTIKALLQKPEMTKYFTFQFKEKRKENMICKCTYLC